MPLIHSNWRRYVFAVFILFHSFTFTLFFLKLDNGSRPKLGEGGQICWLTDWLIDPLRGFGWTSILPHRQLDEDSSSRIYVTGQPHVGPWPKCLVLSTVCCVCRRLRRLAMKEWSIHSAGLLLTFTALSPRRQRTVLSYLMWRKERLSIVWLRLNIFWLPSLLLITWDGIWETFYRVHELYL